MKISSISLPLLVAGASALGDSANAEAAFNTLQGWYNETTGLWNTCGWWNGANAMTSIGDLATVDSNITSEATAVFANTYKNAPPYRPNAPVMKAVVNGLPVSYYSQSNEPMAATDDSSDGYAEGFLDNCYDDNGWWATAWIKAYDITGEANYLSLAEGIFNNMTGAGPTNCSDGGIIWCAARTPDQGYYVNAIANELYLSVAALLANRVGSNKTYYQTIAENQWTWFKNSGMINDEGTINDGLTLDCKNNGATVWSYNQGVILGGLVELNKANGDASLLTSATDIAQAAITNLTDSNHVLHDPCEPDGCAPDGTQFKGAFIRNLVQLQQVAPNDAFKQVIDASANSIWANDRSASNDSLSVVWSGPFVNPANASTHSSAFEALIAQVVVG